MLAPSKRLAQVMWECMHDRDVEVSRGYVATVRYSLAKFRKFLGREPTIADLTRETVNGYVDQLIRELAHDSARTQRGNLMILWHYAYNQGQTDVPPLRVRKLARRQRIPKAWTPSELGRLVDAASRQQGLFRNLPISRALWWESLIRAAYDTALRLGDLERLTCDDLVAGAIVQSKTKTIVRIQVSPETQEAIVRLTAAREGFEPIWQKVLGRQEFYKMFTGLVKQAGIRPGTFKWIRRTAVTQLERVAPGAGTRLAGHRHRSTTENWYLDQSQMDAAPLPPRWT